MISYDNVIYLGHERINQIKFNHFVLLYLLQQLFTQLLVIRRKSIGINLLAFLLLYGFILLFFSLQLFDGI